MDIQKSPQLLAKEIFQQECSDLFMEWLNSYYIGHVVEKTALPFFLTSYDLLVKFKHGEKNKFKYNDLDCSAFYIPSDNGIKIICHEGQSHNFIYVFRDNNFRREFHVRQYYDVYKPQDKWETEEEEEFKKQVAKLGKKHAIAQVKYMTHWADDYASNLYPERLSLKTFKQMLSNSNLNYGDKPYPVYWDARDRGYIISYRNMFVVKEVYKADTVITPIKVQHVLDLCLNSMATYLNEEYSNV